MAGRGKPLGWSSVANTTPQQAEVLEKIRVAAEELKRKRAELAADELAMRELIRSSMNSQHRDINLTAVQIRSVTDLFSEGRLYQIAGRALSTPPVAS